MEQFLFVTPQWAHYWREQYVMKFPELEVLESLETFHEQAWMSTIDIDIFAPLLYNCAEYHQGHKTFLEKYQFFKEKIFLVNRGRYKNHYLLKVFWMLKALYQDFISYWSHHHRAEILVKKILTFRTLLVDNTCSTCPLFRTKL